MVNATILGGVSGHDLTAAERDFFSAAQPWAFILFGRNVDNPEQLRRLTSDLRDSVGRDAPVMIDQEGGRVQRMRAPHWAEWPAPLDQAVAGARAMWLRYRLIGAELHAAGIDTDCAPTLDIARDDTHPFLQNRCFGRDAATVIRLGRAAADGLVAAGVMPVMKHMPGHGLARVDSHKDLPVVDAPLSTLLAQDFAPFAALHDIPMAMTAHIRFTAIDDAPATTSAKVIAVIREQIGYDGLLMTDDITMQALPGSMGERAAASVAAGCDLVLHCNGTIAAMEEVVANTPALGGDALRRADRALATRRTPEPADLTALRAEYAALMAQAGVALA